MKTKCTGFFLLRLNYFFFIRVENERNVLGYSLLLLSLAHHRRITIYSVELTIIVSNKKEKKNILVQCEQFFLRFISFSSSFSCNISRCFPLNFKRDQWPRRKPRSSLLFFSVVVVFSAKSTRSKRMVCVCVRWRIIILYFRWIIAYSFIVDELMLVFILFDTNVNSTSLIRTRCAHHMQNICNFSRTMCASTLEHLQATAAYTYTSTYQIPNVVNKNIIIKVDVTFHSYFAFASTIRAADH